jgi:hypothetical protein
MTKVSAVMFTACKRLTTYNRASVFPVGITCSAEFSVRSAAYFGALVFFTRLILVANSIALQIVNFLYLLLSQKALSLGNRIRSLVAKHFLSKFTTRTLLFSWFIASHALAVMALFCALVFATRQEPFAESLACWNGIRT